MFPTLGPADGDVIIAGHSHMFALGVHQRYQGPIALVPCAHPRRSCFFLMEEWKGDRTSGYWDTLVRMAANRSVLIVFNGNQHYSDFLLAPDPLFDFVDDVDPDVHPDAIAVPRRLVKAHFEPSLGQLQIVIARLHEAGCRFVAVLGTPPPKADLVKFTDVIRQSRYFARVAQARGIDLQTVAMIPPRILLKMWRIIQELLSDVASAGKATFVPVPRETMTAEGFLGHEFYGFTEGDLTHANTAYGAHMMEVAMRHFAEPLHG